jgi:hypothetical protein
MLRAEYRPWPSANAAKARGTSPNLGRYTNFRIAVRSARQKRRASYARRRLKENKTMTIPDKLKSLPLQRDKPHWIRIIAVCFGVIGLLQLVFGLFIIAYSHRPQIADTATSKIMSFFFGIVGIFGIFPITVGIGLFLTKNWARISAIIVSIIGVIMMICLLFTLSYLGLVVKAIIVLIILLLVLAVYYLEKNKTPFNNQV